MTTEREKEIRDLLKRDYFGPKGTDFIAELLAEVDAERQTVAKLREALKFYAYPGSYSVMKHNGLNVATFSDWGPSADPNFRGNYPGVHARDALKENP